ncbi:39S ribosomal protein L47, mitochondrial-like [Paramacrobiotus metropolitanus]|uniref:39S ribosomal protein L47, mitochondrial-like n=1 Tax=Paramacrobiotus metropolitanus TaxID=2943436 RepID=UPI0024459E5C|nr:39S ribosomal protein L47, mitochondrial-like [Paramacrobiotus metropolitanus]
MTLLSSRLFISTKPHSAISCLLNNLFRSVENCAVLSQKDSSFPISSSGKGPLLSPRAPLRHFHTTPKRWDLMEFFDEQKNWGARDVRSGRSWTKDDLRLKSNTDLHKLWLVLYKERNMLYTMQAEYERLVELFPNPERIDKVEESMSNLQAVVDERNRAVKLLEVGVTGEAPKRTVYSGLGRRYEYTYSEHLMPYWRNAKHFKRRYEQVTTGAKRDFLLKLWAKNRKARQQLQKKQIAILSKAKDEYPDEEVWQQGLDVNEMKLKDVYHSKMSD